MTIPHEEKRFLDKVIDGEEKPGLPGNCLIWTGARHERGYGRFRHRGRVRTAHRVSWELAHGKGVPDHMNVLHRCDNPSCVNPAHLYLGTQRENMQDRISRGVSLRLPQTIPEAKRRLELARQRVEKASINVERLERRLAWLERTAPSSARTIQLDKLQPNVAGRGGV